jgi:hypothetical protein
MLLKKYIFTNSKTKLNKANIRKDALVWSMSGLNHFFELTEPSRTKSEIWLQLIYL